MPQENTNMSYLGVGKSDWGDPTLKGRGMHPTSFLNVLDSESNIFTVGFQLLNNPKRMKENFKNQSNVENMIKSVTLPDIGFDDNPIKKLGYNIHKPGDINIGNLTLTSYSDKNNQVFSFWNNWYRFIIEGEGSGDKGGSNYRSFPDDFKINIIVAKLSREVKNKEMSIYILENCYPSNIGNLTLDWESSDTAPIFTMEIKCDNMKFFAKDISNSKVKTGAIKDNLDGRPSKIKNANDTRSGNTSYSKIDKIIKSNLDGRPGDPSKYGIGRTGNTAYTKIDQDFGNRLELSLKSKIKKLIVEKVKKLLIRAAEKKFKDLLPNILGNLTISDIKNGNIDKFYRQMETRTLADLNDGLIALNQHINDINKKGW